MPTVGPQLPPSPVEKRKRSYEDSESSDGESASFQSVKDHREERLSPSTSKRPRVIGPTLPPAPLDERPPQSTDYSDRRDDGSDVEEEHEEEDEDDFGPHLPPTDDSAKKPFESGVTGPQQVPPSGAPVPSKRDDWMTVPPTHGDWSVRVDPTKLKNRRFNTGKGAKAPPSQEAGGMGDSWHETPAQKQARLQREIMGIKDRSDGSRAGATRSKDEIPDKATAQRLKEYNVSPCSERKCPATNAGIQETARGPSLYESHQRTNPQEKEDDPSARAFDREKDIAGGIRINSTQRRDMMKKAADFSSRFSSAKYL